VPHVELELVDVATASFEVICGVAVPQAVALPGVAGSKAGAPAQDAEPAGETGRVRHTV